MFNNNKDEYVAATEKASINQHGKEKSRGYKLGIFNLFLLTTIGVMGYVSFDSLKSESHILEKITHLNSSDSELIKILSTVDIAEEKDGLESLSSAINDVVNDASVNDTSYEQALSNELERVK
jgi:hypothetical protein